MKLDNVLRANRIIVPAVLICITALAAVLRLHDLGRAGLGNLFYASTVYSMGLSLSNFLYAAYDPLGTFIVDKPPVALWLQVIFSKLIGFSGLAMILPMALASTAAVPLLYVTSKRAFGTGIGLLAAMIFAVLPVSVSTARDSSMDSMLMLFLLPKEMIRLLGMRMMAMKVSRHTSSQLLLILLGRFMLTILMVMVIWIYSQLPVGMV